MDPAQLSSYLRRIGAPPGSAAGSLQPSLRTLSLLHWKHLTNIPFENLSINPNLGLYERARRHPVSLRLEDIHRKLVVARRGGWCYEVRAAADHRHPTTGAYYHPPPPCVSPSVLRLPRPALRTGARARVGGRRSRRTHPVPRPARSRPAAQMNGLFGAALRSLGFEGVLDGGARVVPPAASRAGPAEDGALPMRARTHHILFVALPAGGRCEGRSDEVGSGEGSSSGGGGSSELWLADVGLGGDLPPLPLRVPPLAELAGRPGRVWEAEEAWAPYAGCDWAAELPLDRMSQYRWVHKIFIVR